MLGIWPIRAWPGCGGPQGVKWETNTYRTLANQIFTIIKNDKKATPLASGNVMLELSSMEGLIRVVGLSDITIGNVRCRITGMPEETTYDVVIHGIPVEEDLACLQVTLKYDRSKGAALIRVERLKNKRGAPSTADK